MSMVKNLSLIFLAMGIMLLLHSGYSAREYVLHFKQLEIESVSLSLPLDIKIETLMGLTISIVGCVFYIGIFKDIMLSTELKKYTMDGMFSAPSFITFNHRESLLNKGKSE